jgi:hypothetical protein
MLSAKWAQLTSDSSLLLAYTVNFEHDRDRPRRSILRFVPDSSTDLRSQIADGATSALVYRI